jgi:excisionase family DNA binding protein
MLTQERTEFITVEQAAVNAHVSSITIRRAIRDGKLRYRAEQGRTRLLSAVEVDAWARERTELRLLNGDK